MLKLEEFEICPQSVFKAVTLVRENQFKYQ